MTRKLKLILLLLTLLFFLPVSGSVLSPSGEGGAPIHIDARTIDAKTGERLPFASVYISGQKSTISNAEGEFVIDADSADVLRISYVGYKTVHLRAVDIGQEVLLSSEGEMLGEVVVLGTDFIIKKALARHQKEAKKYGKKKSNFFYRQVSKNNRQCTAFLESFFSAKSAYELSDLQLVTGRYVSVASRRTMNPTNYFTFAQVALYSEPVRLIGATQLVPLCEDYRRHFETDVEVISDGERRIYVVYFVPRNPNYWAVTARLYIDANTFQVLRYQGFGNNDRVWHREHGSEEGKLTERTIEPADYSFVINYQHDNGFTEVQSVHFLVTYEHAGNRYETTGMMFNVANRFVKGKTAMSFSDNLMSEISKGKKNKDKHYNQKFWEQLEIVKRTPLESEVVELFERDNLFGVF